MLFLLLLVGCSPKQEIYVPKPELGRAANFIAVDTEKQALAYEVQSLRYQLAEATKGGWTGAKIYWSQGCAPCVNLDKAIDSRAKVGWTRGVGEKFHFWDVEWNESHTDIALTPTIVYFKDGKEIGRIEGFDGSKEALDAILLKHPACKKFKAVKPVQQSVSEVIVPQVWFEWSYQ